MEEGVLDHSSSEVSWLDLILVSGKHCLVCHPPWHVWTRCWQARSPWRLPSFGILILPGVSLEAWDCFTTSTIKGFFFSFKFRLVISLTNVVALLFVFSQRYTSGTTSTFFLDVLLWPDLCLCFLIPPSLSVCLSVSPSLLVKGTHHIFPRSHIPLARIHMFHLIATEPGK